MLAHTLVYFTLLWPESLLSVFPAHGLFGSETCSSPWSSVFLHLGPTFKFHRPQVISPENTRMRRLASHFAQSDDRCIEGVRLCTLPHDPFYHCLGLITTFALCPCLRRLLIYFPHPPLGLS
ncbi:hypothetical protein C8R43DRAFT_999440 [Mycena crocata]|nr:hypothetical protein C8R43DRAFT_999440 [Mycena crocata]